MLVMIFACDEQNAIGKDGDLPWRQSSDLQHFKRTTLHRTVVMGRKTWDSLGKPLPKRRNVVMSRTTVNGDVEQMDEAAVLALAEEEDVYIIGGGEIYALFMKHCKELHRTVIHTTVEGADAFAPSLEGEGFHLVGERHVPSGPKDDHAMTFEHWIR